MNNEDFCSYDIATKLKELGFEWPCRHYYTKENVSDNDVWLTTAAFSPEDWNNGRNAKPDFLKPLCSAPSLWKAQKWLREVHKLSVEPICNMVRQWNVNVCDIDKFGEILWAKIGLDTYESALSDGIETALKLIEIDKTKKS